MKKFIPLFFISLIFGCASRGSIVFPDDVNDISSLAISSAKGNTNMIGRLRFDGRVKKEKISDGVDITRFWFVGFRWDIENFQNDITTFCEKNNGTFEQFGTQGELKVDVVRFWDILITQVKDQRAFVFECTDNESKNIRYSFAINRGDVSSSEGGDVVKVRVATFGNKDKLDKELFRKKYIKITKYFNGKWSSDY